MNKNRRAFVSVMGVVAILLAVFLYRMQQRKSLSPRAAVSDSSAALPPGAGRRLEPGMPIDPSLSASEGTTEEAAIPLAGMEQTRDAYVEYSIYPPWSRPATPNYFEIYQFNQTPVEHSQPIGMLGEQVVHGKLSLDRYFVEPGRPGTVVAEVWVEEPEGKRALDFEATAEVHLDIGEEHAEEDDVGAFMRGYRVASRQTRLTRSAASSNHKSAVIHVDSFARKGEPHRNARLIVYLVPEGGEVRPLAVNFMYSAAPPLEIVSISNDEVVNGSLEVTFVVDVFDPVPIRLRAALAQVGERDAPIAVYDNWFRPTEKGPQRMTMTFFGRAIRESERNGPYEIFSIHGSAYFADEPVPDVFWQEDQFFVTEAHRAADFSMAKWDSPERDTALKNYARSIESLRTQIR